jgi:hypothetical protein
MCVYTQIDDGLSESRREHWLQFILTLYLGILFSNQNKIEIVHISLILSQI